MIKRWMRPRLLRRTASEFGLPVVVKPVTQGSSIGVFIVDDSVKLLAAIQDALHYKRSGFGGRIYPRPRTYSSGVSGR